MGCYSFAVALAVALGYDAAPEDRVFWTKVNRDACVPHPRGDLSLPVRGSSFAAHSSVPPESRGSRDVSSWNALVFLIIRTSSAFDVLQCVLAHE